MGIPNFFLAVLLIQFFGVQLGWLPVAGPGDWKHLVLPAIVLCVESVALNLRLMRSSVLEELSLDYMRTLRAKGLSERRMLVGARVPQRPHAGGRARRCHPARPCSDTRWWWRRSSAFEGLGYQFVQGDHPP